MNIRLYTIGIAAISLAGGPLSAQTLQRRASIVGGGSPDRGKCTIEVVVDGAAEVEVRGENATLRNLNGQLPQWRRFECTMPMPNNPVNFRFSGVDGRGSQELVRAPQNGGTVVRIQDPDGGTEGYTFDLTWGPANRPGDSGFIDQRPGNGPRPGPGPGPGFGPGPGRRFTTEQAVQVCQDTVRRQAFDRFRTGDIAFRRTALDDNPGRQDWVTGLFDIRRGYDRDEVYRFSCSVNFDNGEVRSSQIDPVEPDRYLPGFGDARRAPARVAMESCQRSVEANLRQKGFQHVDFLSINTDDRPGRNDWIVGNARADVRNRSTSFSFSCSVDLRDGDVRSVDVRRR